MSCNGRWDALFKLYMSGGLRGAGFKDGSAPLMVQCPACKGVGWVVLFVVRRDCGFCEGNREVDAEKWLGYDSDA